MKTLSRGRAGSRTLAADLNANFLESGSVAKLSPVTGASSFSVPAGHRITSIDILNTTANAVTGGVKIGTTNGGTDVVAAQAVGANALVSVADADILQKFFSDSAAQTLYVGAVTAWNSASLKISVGLQKVF